MRIIRQLSLSHGRHRKFDLWRRGIVIVICLASSSILWLRVVSAQDLMLPAKTTKDQQQDDHLHSTDQQVLEVRQLLHDVDQNEKEIRAQLGEAKVRIGSDEGMATGAFIILGILETLGLLTRIKPDSNKPV